MRRLVDGAVRWVDAAAEFPVDRRQRRAGEQLPERRVHVGDHLRARPVVVPDDRRRPGGHRLERACACSAVPSDADAAAANRCERCAGRGMLLVSRRLHLGTGAVGRHQAGRRAGERRPGPDHRHVRGCRRFRRPASTPASRKTRSIRSAPTASSASACSGKTADPAASAPVRRIPASTTRARSTDAGPSRSRWRGSCRIRCGCSPPTTTAS